MRASRGVRRFDIRNPDDMPQNLTYQSTQGFQENEVQLVLSLMNEWGVRAEEQHYQHMPLGDMVGESQLG